MRLRTGIAVGMGALLVAPSTLPARPEGAPPVLRARPTADVLQRKVIGTTVGDRKIRAVQIGNPEAHRTVVVVGCIHGNERAGIAVVRMLKDLRAPDDLNIWLIKSLNPDGAAAGTRQNGLLPENRWESAK